MAQPKSIRLPEEAWERLTTRAEAQRTTVHALLKRVVQEYLSSEKTRPTTGLERDVYDLAAGMDTLMEEMSKILQRLALLEDISDRTEKIQKILNQHR